MMLHNCCKGTDRKRSGGWLWGAGSDGDAVYFYGVERLDAESARERVLWVSAIWYVPLVSAILQAHGVLKGDSRSFCHGALISLKRSHLWAPCVRSGRWRVRVPTPIWVRVLPRSFHRWTPFRIYPISVSFGV